jgi:hypothetical protein
MTDDFWRSAQETWQSFSPAGQVALRAAGLVVAALVAARAAGWWVGRRLRAGHFDAALRRPWSPPPTGSRTPDPHALTPTRLVTGLVRLTVWGAALWALAYLSDWPEMARGLAWAAGRVWALAAIVLVALYLSRVLAEKLVEVVQASPLRHQFDGWQAPAAGRDARPGGPAILAGLVADVVVVLLALLVAADLTGLALAADALSAAWHLVVHVLTAGVVLVIGWVGARSVRAQVAPDAGPASSPAGYRAFAAATVMGGAVLMAVLLLAGDWPTYFGVVLVVLVALLVWPARRWLPDIYAGVLLRGQRVKEVRIDGGTYPVGAVGLLQTQVQYPDGVRPRRNRAVLEAHLANPADGTQAAAGSAGGKPEPANPV